jgi:hypothetical protein
MIRSRKMHARISPPVASRDKDIGWEQHWAAASALVENAVLKSPTDLDSIYKRGYKYTVIT